jgi:hypothetical protein
MPVFDYSQLMMIAEIKKNPEIFAPLTEEQIAENSNKVAAKARVRDELNAAARDENASGHATKYNELRNQLFTLQQNAKATETLVNITVDKIRHHEERIGKLKELAKAATTNPHEERMYLHQLKLEQGYLADAQDELFKARKRNSESVKALRQFDQKELDRLRKKIESSPATNHDTLVQKVAKEQGMPING